MRAGCRNARLVGALILTAGVWSRSPAIADTAEGELATVTGASAGDSAVDDAVQRGVSFLLQAQNRDGSWGSGASRRPVEILADIPGSHRAFRAGCTALAIMALSRSPVEEDRCRAAVLRGVEYLIEHARVRRPNGLEMYNVWAFGYTLEAFGRLLPQISDESIRRRMLATSQDLVKALGVYQTPDGGWGYYDFIVGSYRPGDASMSFTTATILVALNEIERHGVAVSRRMIERAVLSLRHARKEDGSFLYGFDSRYRPQAGYNKVKGSLGRTQACHLALALYTDGVDRRDMLGGLERFFRHHHFMDIGRKRPWPHEAWYYTSGYYYYYGIYYAARIVERVGSDASRKWGGKLDDIVVARQEPDGSWWDFPFYSYHKSYGTAYALLALLRPRQ